MRPRAVIESVIDTSQLKVLVAAHYTDLHTGYVTAPMSFTNSARTCELFSDTPVVQAASGPQRTPVGVATPNGDLIGPGVLLKDGQSSLSMLDLAREAGVGGEVPTGGHRWTRHQRRTADRLHRLRPLRACARMRQFDLREH
jgi:hypothetical protein